MGVSINRFFVEVPIGAMVMWDKSMTGVPGIPANFKECDGTNIVDTESPMNGQATLNMNNGNFARGASTSGGFGGTSTHTHPWGGAATYDTSSLTQGPAVVSHIPPYFNVVFIIRIK